MVAGGESRRMGRDKAFLAGADGRPLVEVALDALRAAGAAHLLIAANDPARFESLGVRVVPDAVPGEGPLRGIQAALEAAATDWCLVVACDMPHLDAELLRQVAARMVAPFQVVVPEAGGRLQPLHAGWHRSALLEIQSALAEGERSLMGMLERLDADRVELPEGPGFKNVNRPEDL